MKRLVGVREGIVQKCYGQNLHTSRKVIRAPGARTEFSLRLEDALLEKGFKHVHGYLRDHDLAMKTLVSAAEAFPGAASRQDKRGDYSAQFRVKITLTREQLFQRLLWEESVRYELQQEASGTLTQTEMVERYVKHLVLITAHRYAAWPAVAINSFIYSFETPHAREMYLQLSANHYPDDDALRRIKADIRTQLQERFRGLRMVTSTRGDMRFAPVEDQTSLRNCVKEHLGAFTPWGTTCVGNTDAGWDAAIRSESDEDDEINRRRIHTLIHPECYWRLASTMGMTSPEECLAIPHLVLRRGGKSAEL